MNRGALPQRGSIGGFVGRQPPMYSRGASDQAWYPHASNLFHVAPMQGSTYDDASIFAAAAVVITPSRATIILAAPPRARRAGRVVAFRAPTTLPPAFAKPPPPTIIDPVRGRTRGRVGNVIAPRRGALADIVRPPAAVIVDPVRGHRPLPAARVIAPRPAGLAVTAAAPTVTPPRTITVILAGSRVHVRGGSVSAPRAPSTLPPAFAKPPLPEVVWARQTRSQRHGGIVAPRPAGLAVTQAAPAITPPRALVILARMATRQRHGDAVTPRPAALSVTPTPPRSVSTHLARAVAHALGGDVVAPRPMALATGIAPPVIIVTGSFNTHPRGQVADTATEQSYAGHARGRPDSNPSEGRFNTL